MANPLGAANVVGHNLKYSELGLASATILATASPVSLSFTNKTPVPETVVVLWRLSSGTLDVQVEAASSTTFGSATYTSGAKTGTKYECAVVNTSAANPYVNVNLVTSANAILDRLMVMTLAELEADEDWYNVRDGVMAVANTTHGDGSGTMSFTTSD